MAEDNRVACSREMFSKLLIHNRENMTVQELFKHGDLFRDKIFDYYMKTYCEIKESDLEKDIFPEGMTNKEEKYNFLMKVARDNFNKGYNDILKIDPIINNDDMCIVYPITYVGESDKRTYDVSYIQIDDFLEAYEHQDYVTNIDELMTDRDVCYISIGMMYMEREDMLGMRMAKTSLDMYPIEEVIGSIFFELTWFGYTNEEYAENLHKELEIIDAQLSETYSYDEEEEDEEYIESIKALLDEEEDEEFEQWYNAEADADAINNFNQQVKFYDALLKELGGNRDE